MVVEIRTALQGLQAELERTRDHGGAPGKNGTTGNGAAPRALSDGEAETLRRLAALDPLRLSPMEALSELVALVELATRAEWEPAR